MEQAAPRSLTASIDVDAPPADVWRIVADVRRTGEWSPECVGVTPLGRLATGSFLFGRNRRGRVRWVTVSRITEFRPDAAIGWTVLTNRSQWRYELHPAGAGTRVVQTRETPRGEGRFAVWFTGRFLGGQADHDDELEAGMAAGLQRIKGLAEQASVHA